MMIVYCFFTCKYDQVCRRMGDVSNVGGGDVFIQTNGFHKHFIEVVCNMNILLKDLKKIIYVYGYEEIEVKLKDIKSAIPLK